MVEELVTVCENNDIEYVPRYSGRGMYGRTCFGIVGHAGDLATFLMGVSEDTREKLQDGWRTDNMGLDTIYYWQNVAGIENGE